MDNRNQHSTESANCHSNDDQCDCVGRRRGRLARGMASHGVFLGLCGFEYHGPRGHIGFAPKIAPDDFRAAFTAVEGWGTISQSRTDGGQTARIEMKWGRLTVRTIGLDRLDWRAFGLVDDVAGGRM